MFGRLRDTMRFFRAHPKIRTELHDAAKRNRRLKNWAPTGETIDSMMRSSSDTIVSRSRQLATANAYAISAKESFAAHLIGPGIRVRSLLKDTDQRKRVMDLWRDWTFVADADGTNTLYGLQTMIGHELFVAGEIFFRKRLRSEKDGLPVPIQFQPLSTEYLDRSFSQELPGGHKIKSGIEFDLVGRRVAYHFFRSHPGDTVTPGGSSTDRVRVPAESVLHVYRAESPGQIRGVPRILGGMIRAFNLDAYDDAQLERQKISALIAAFVTKADDGSSLVNSPGEDDDDTADGSVDIEWAPATISFLEAGESIEFSQPADISQSYDPFMRRNLLAIAAAWSVPYAHMTGDMANASYSSQRAAMLEHRRRMTQLQTNVIVYQFARRVWREWVTAAAFAGKLQGDLDEILNSVKFILPRWDWIDPLKDRQAEKLAVDNLFKPRSGVVEAEGEDPEENDEIIRQDDERAREKGNLTW